MKRWRLSGVLLSSIAASGCFSLPAGFLCATDSQCTQEGATDHGVCVPATRHCAFPSSGCASGYIYGALAGSDSGRCLDPGELTRPGDGGGDAMLGGDGGGDGGGGDLAPGGCPRPYLMVATENLSLGPGVILRFSIDDAGLHRCLPDLTGGGSLGSLPHAVAFIPPSSIAVAATDGVFLIDPAVDAISWSDPNPTANTPKALPMDVLPLQLGGTTQVAVAWDAAISNPSTMTDLYVYKDSTGPSQHWTFAQLNLSSVYGVTVSLLDPAHLFALSYGGAQAAAYDVVPAMPSSNTRYSGDPGAVSLGTISSLTAGGAKRTVWIEDQPGTGAPTGLRYADDTGGGGALMGPARCTACPTPLRAVPDPTAAGRFLVLCEDAINPANQRTLRRFHTDNTCESLFDGTTLPTDHRMWHLGVAMP